MWYQQNWWMLSREDWLDKVTGRTNPWYMTQTVDLIPGPHHQNYIGLLFQMWSQSLTNATVVKGYLYYSTSIWYVDLSMEYLCLVCHAPSWTQFHVASMIWAKAFDHVIYSWGGPLQWWHLHLTYVIYIGQWKNQFFAWFRKKYAIMKTDT